MMETERILETSGLLVWVDAAPRPRGCSRSDTGIIYFILFYFILFFFLEKPFCKLWLGHEPIFIYYRPL
jgi:hypothetical protein